MNDPLKEELQALQALQHVPSVPSYRDMATLMLALLSRIHELQGKVASLETRAAHFRS